MGTKMVILALILLLPNVVSAEAERENEGETPEACDPVRIYYEPPNVIVEPQCALNGFAEESK